VCGLTEELDKLYRTYRQALYTSALSITRSPEGAEDAIQDAFYRLYRLEQRPANFKAYVWSAVRHAAIDQLRRRPREAKPLDGSIFDPGPAPDRQAEERILAERVTAALEDLSDDEREAVVQHLYGGLTFREIAEARGLPLGTITSWYQRGIGKLRISLEAVP
jgi:RNA polymerase sigma factor (sigma-70 family)